MSENKTNNHIKIGVLAVQGAFAEHRQILEKLGVETFEIRQLRDLEQDFDGLILPGGESTVQGKLLHDLGLFEPLRERIESGLPTLGTCAGLILLAEKLSNDGHTYFATTPVTVERNAYGRQLGSFYTEENFEGIGKIPMTFIPSEPRSYSAQARMCKFSRPFKIKLSLCDTRINSPFRSTRNSIAIYECINISWRKL